MMSDSDYAQMLFPPQPSTARRRVAIRAATVIWIVFVAGFVASPLIWLTLVALPGHLRRYRERIGSGPSRLSQASVAYYGTSDW